MIITRPPTFSRRVALSATAGLAVAATLPSAARADERSIEQWIASKAVGLTTTDPAAPLGDLRSLQRSLAGAVLVGLGEPAHTLAEITTLKHRMVRLMIERLGYRSLIWEDDWSLGLLIDEYVHGGAGDLSALIKQLSYNAWQTEQVADLLTWLRHHNARHPHDQVSFVGAEHYATRSFVYDRLSAYVAETAPGIHAEVEELINALRPDPKIPIGQYAWDYYELEVADKEPFLRRAKRLRELVDGIRRPARDRRHSVARQTARQIEAFYIHYSLPWAEIPSYRDAGSARTIQWWLGHDRTKAIYWAATPHTSRAPEVRYSRPSGPMAYVPAGFHLARALGDRYRVVGFAFDHGTYRLPDGTIIDLPRPLPEWYESRFAGLDHEQSAIDLRQRASGAVRDWLAAPFRARGFPDLGVDSSATGGTLAEWFDVIIHRRVVSPADPYR